MNYLQAVEENVLAYYKGIARLLDGRIIETDEVVWFTTGRRMRLKRTYHGWMKSAFAPRIVRDDH